MIRKKFSQLRLVVLIILLNSFTQIVFAQNSIVYEFNTANQLSNLFNRVGPGINSVTQETTGGLSNSGSIAVPLSSSVDAVYTTKDGYSLGPVGSSYVFESFIKSEGNSGYSGVGFTTTSPTTASTVTAYRPNVVLGISVHGGGFIFHNDGTNYSGNWNQSSSGSITSVRSSACNDLINSTSTTCGSPDRWYKILFRVERASSTSFNMRVEIWPANVDGTLRYSQATAIFEVNGVTNTAISNANQIFSYFSFSGTRVTRFDNYRVNLAGGSSVIQSGFPIVLTPSLTTSNNVVTVNGNVTSANGSTVTERGIVYGTTSNPTVSDNKIVSGSGTGTFSGITPTLPPGTYYFRAYATNSAGTSYGAELTTIFAVAPVITSFSPSTAGNGETVVITGTGFDGISTVKFGNVNATSFVVNSSTQITAVVGTGASGDVLVQNPAGSDAEGGFIFKVVELKFEGNTLDQTAADRDGTIVGTATYGTGASGQAICFTNNNVVNGTTVQNYLRLPDDLIRGRGENFTISLRFKTASYGAILGYQNAGVGNVSQYVPILYVRSDGKLSANLWQASNQPLNVLSSNRVDDNNWHKVEFSAAAGSITVYIDGVSAGTSNGTIAHLSMSFNQIGAVNTAGVWTGDPIDGWFGFNGCIDEFIVVDRSLTASQIEQVTQIPLPTITSFTPTTAKSGETVTITGTNFANASSVKLGGVDARRFTIVSATEIRAIVPFNATVNSTVEVTNAVGTISATTFTYDCNNNALDFDGVNDFVQVGSPLPLTSGGNFTIEGWVKPSLIDENFHGFFGLETQSGGRAPSLWVGPNGTLYADAYNASNTNDRYLMQIDNFFTLNTWVHVAFVRSGSTFIIYKNGVQVGTRTAPASVNLPNANFWIGKVDNFFGGSLDEVRVWNTARTPQLLLSGMGAELVGNEGGLVAYYNFNQGVAAGSNNSITTLSNLTSGINLNGTLTNLSRSGNASNFVSGVWPVIIVQPAATLTVCPSTSTSIAATAVGPQLTYQWYSNSSASNTGGTAITGATTSTYTLTAGTSGSQYFYVVVSGTCSQSATSSVTTVTVAPIPVISYSSSSYSVERTSAITAIQPTSTGATVASYAISPALPTGLSINTTTGIISGTPSVNSTSRTYTVTATSATGCVGTTTLTLEVFNAVAPSALSFAPGSQTVRQGTAITNMVPTASGGAVASYSISPALPAGLSFNTTTGIISGTLTAQQTGTVTYTITATNSGGSTTATVTLVYNTAPTDVALSSTSVAENAASGTSVATLSATDADAGDTFTYTLVSGSGSTDNASFTISGNTLRTAAVFDFETKSSYSVRVRVTDAGGLTFEKVFTISVTDVNETPTNITASASSVAENATSGTTVATLSATDIDAGETFTYTFVSGTGDTDNASFTISGSTLSTAGVFDFETKSSYSVRVRVTDAGGLTFEKIFTIGVTDVNEAPTALALSNASVLENAASGTTVGTLAGTDADAGDTHTYSLVTGTGSTDNASFTITGTTLSTAAVFNFEAKNSYAVRVRVTDAGGLSFERAFTISVTDVNEAPTLTAITDRRVYNVSTSQVVNLAGITAGPETAQSTTTTVSTDRPATFSSISVVGTQIQFTLAAGIVTPQDVVVTVRVRDNGGVANGGVDSVVRTFRLGIDPMPVASATPNLITLGATAQLSATGANAVNYTWVAVGGSGIVGSGANINVRPRGTTTYEVVVTNSFGYQATVPVLLTVIVDYKLVPNNLVTPNGDGVNDRWVIPNIDMYPENEVMVYDKAGRAVFAKRGYNNEWDGTVNGKLLKEDAYFYVIKFNKDGALPIRGYVSIVR